MACDKFSLAGAALTLSLAPVANAGGVDSDAELMRIGRLVIERRRAAQHTGRPGGVEAHQKY